MIAEYSREDVLADRLSSNSKMSEGFIRIITRLPRMSKYITSPVQTYESEYV